MADTRIARARQAFRQLGGSRPAARRPCPACGSPVGEERSIELRGDTFHARCVLYQPQRGSRKA